MYGEGFFKIERTDTKKGEKRRREKARSQRQRKRKIRAVISVVSGFELCNDLKSFAKL